MNSQTNKWPSVSGKKRMLRIPGVENEFKIGAWNVRSLYDAGKLANTIVEMKRLNLKVLGTCEIWWPGSGQCRTNDMTFYDGGNQGKDHRNGVGVIVHKDISQNVTDFVPFSDRVMLLKIGSKPVNVDIGQVYAPTLDKSDDEIVEFYEDFNSPNPTN